MTGGWQRTLALASTLLIAALFGLVIYLVVVGDSGALTMSDVIQFNLWMTAFTVVGLFIAIRVPDNLIGWLCLATAGSWAVSSLADPLLGYYNQNPESITWIPVVFAIVFPFWVPGVVLIGFLILYFPDGRLPSSPAKWVARVLAATTAYLMVTGLIVPDYDQVYDDVAWENPFAVDYPVAIANAAVVVLAVCLLASAVVLVGRFRRSSGVERMQLKWLTAAGSVAAIGYLVLMVSDIVFDVSGVHPQTLFALIPIGIGFAVLRHRLYDIDRIISRTVSYALVVGMLAVVFASIAVGLPRLLPVPEQNPILVAAATLAAAGLFNPLRRRVQATVDRRFNRARYDAAKLLDRLVADLQDNVEIGEIKDRTQVLVTEALAPSSVGIWVADES